MAVYAVIMAGGSGTRFWPVSRQSIPKQCLHITGQNSMIQETVERLSPIIEMDKFYIATGNHLYDSIKNDLPDIGFILEPVARNTAPCIGLSMIHLLHQDTEAVVLLETADHYYHDEELYRQHLQRAIEYAQNNKICLIGIKPTHPATGYGYIQQGNLIDDQGIRIFGVQQFVEKPVLEIAKKYVKSGEYLWNSGIFIAKAQVMLDEIALYMPHLYAGLMKIQTAIKGEDKRAIDMVTREVFESLPPEEVTSIDFGIMEKSKNVMVVEGIFPWYDVGSWLSMEEIIPEDSHENVVNGAGFVGIESRKNIIYSTTGRLITLLGVNDMVIVDTLDALMICPKGKTEDVKKIVDELKRQGMQEYL